MHLGGCFFLTHGTRVFTSSTCGPYTSGICDFVSAFSLAGNFLVTFSFAIVLFLISVLGGLLLGGVMAGRMGSRQAALANAVAASFHRPHKLMHHVTLPTRNGTTEIDHILVADTGVFIIEAKHYAGAVDGSPQDAQWVQMFGRGFRRFQNPIHQNFGHVKAVQSLFRFPDEHFISLVVFTGSARLKADFGPQVITLRELGPFLNQSRPVVFDPTQMAMIIGRIELTRLDRSAETDEQHINNVRARLGRRRR